MTPTISVCVPVYNGAVYLVECLESILGQTFEDFELIVVDDRSSDGSFEIAQGFAARDSRVAIYRNPENLGLTANWNRAVELTKGRWIKFVFQDDLIRPQCLSRMSQYTNGKPGLISCARDLRFEPGVSDDVKTWYGRHAANIARIHPSTKELTAEDVRALVIAQPNENLFGEPTSILLRRDVFELYGSFRTDLVMACDLEYWNRVATNEGAVFIADVLADFRVHETAASADNRNHAAFRSGTLDDLLVLRAYATDPAYQALRRYAGSLTPPRSIDAMLQLRKNEIAAMVAWSSQSGWSGRHDHRETIESFYKKFPDLRPNPWAHFLWRLRLRLRSIANPQTAP